MGLVVLYHFGVRSLTGGFVGVDVFLVISGFLITGIVWERAAAGTFTMEWFYLRRLRRLGPALLVTVVVSYALGCLLFAPLDFVGLSTSTVAALLQVSNLQFWREAGYFDRSKLVKPLLHTWSIGVEVQFYLLWPFLVRALARRGSVVLARTVFAGVGLLSLAASHFWLVRDSTAVFYLTPFRIWEFAAGGLVWLAGVRTQRNWLDESLYSGGLLAIVWSALRLPDGATGPILLVPVAGASLAILGGQARLAALTRWTPIRLLGVISYSVYLIHWPVWVFATYFRGHPAGLHGSLALVALTLSLAVVSYRFVERRFRYGLGDATRAAGRGGAILASLVIVSALTSAAQNGWVWRLPALLRQVNSYDKAAMERYVWANAVSHSATTFAADASRNKVLLVGDSQAADFLNIVLESGGTGGPIVFHNIDARCGGPYIPNDGDQAYWKDTDPYTKVSPEWINVCVTQLRSFAASGAVAAADSIVLAFEWEKWFVQSHLGDALRQIRKRSAAPIYIVSRKEMLKSSIEILTLHRTLNGLEQAASKAIQPYTTETNVMLRNVPDTRFIDLFAQVCPTPTQCHVLTEAGEPIYFDATHVTPAGAAFLGAALRSSRVPFLTADKE